MLQRIFSNVIEVTLIMSAVIAVLLLLLPLLRRRYTARWRSWVWLLVAVRLLIPWNPSLPQAPIRLAAPARQITVTAPARKTTLPLQTGSPASSPATAVPPTRTAIPLMTVLSLVWILGAVAFLLYHFTGYLLFRRAVRRFSRPVEDERILAIWNAVRGEMHVVRPVRLLSCKKVQSPMTTGFFRPVLLLPDLDFRDGDLAMVLKHELVHVKCGDIWYKLLMVCANAVHWFNPLVCFMAAASDRDLEMSCDSSVTRNADVLFRRQYSEAILTAVRKGRGRRTVFSTYFDGGKKAMRERLVNIFDMSRKRRGALALCAVIVIAGILGTAITYDRAAGAVDTSRFRTMNTGVAEPDIDYASGTRVVFHGYFGLFVYDTAGHGQLYRSIDLQKIDSAHIQGSTYTQVTVTKDGKTVYIDNLGEGADDVMYRYDIDADRLSTVKVQKIADPYVPGDIADKAADINLMQEGEGAPSATYGQIDEKTYAYLWDTDDIVRDLKLIVENTQDHSFQVYDVFRPAAERQAEAEAKDRLSRQLPLKTGERIISFDLDDYDGDGSYEAFALVGKKVDESEDFYTGELWFVSKKGLTSLKTTDVFSLSPKPVFYVGNSEFFKIEEVYTTGGMTLVFGVKNSRAYATLLSGRVQDLEQLDDGTFTVQQNTFDAVSDGTGRTVKPYWLYWDNGFREYGGIMITREQLLEFKGADSVLSKITADGSTLTGIIYRANHVININYQTPQGLNHYVTLQYDGSSVLAVGNGMDSGVYDEAFLPDIATYPSAFRHPTGSGAGTTVQARRKALAAQWAEAVRTRNGKAQYDLLSTQLQAAVYASYREEHWVTGQSSPWVQRYEVRLDGDNAVVTYTYATSDGPAGSYDQTLSFLEENGVLRIGSFSDPFSDPAAAPAAVNTGR